MNSLAHRLARLGLGAWLALTAACGSENRLERVDFSYETSPPDEVDVSASSVTLRLGQAVAVRAHPVMSEDPLEDDDHFELRSRDESVLGLDSGGDRFLFVLYGIAPGDTSVQALVNGRPGPVIAAHVLDTP